jgi:hypothetical protein
MASVLARAVCWMPILLPLKSRIPPTPERSSHRKHPGPFWNRAPKALTGMPWARASISEAPPESPITSALEATACTSERFCAAPLMVRSIPSSR